MRLLFLLRGTDQSELRHKITISLFASFMCHSQNLQLVATKSFASEFMTMNRPGAGCNKKINTIYNVTLDIDECTALEN